MNTEKRHIIVHVHIFKNGGTTFDYALEKNFGEGFVDHRDDQQMRQGKMEYLLKYLRDNPRVVAISSHVIHFPLVSQDEFEFIPVYFLRHPIERVRSVYTFECKQSPEISLGAKMANSLSYEEYMQWRLGESSPPAIRNIQTIFLSGMSAGSKAMDEKFQSAQATLNSNALIGIVDRYDESMIVFETQLKKVFPDIDLSYIRQNITDKEPEMVVDMKVRRVLDSLNEEMQEKLIKANEMDMALYRGSIEKLEHFLSTLDSNDRLTDFKNRCNSLFEKR